MEMKDAEGPSVPAKPEDNRNSSESNTRNSKLSALTSIFVEIVNHRRVGGLKSEDVVQKRMIAALPPSHLLHHSNGRPMHLLSQSSSHPTPTTMTST